MWFWTIETDYEKEREHDIEFEVPDSWFNKWFELKRKGKETRGNIESERYESLQDFLDDWILDDSLDMFWDANKDDVVIGKRNLSEWIAI